MVADPTQTVLGEESKIQDDVSLDDILQAYDNEDVKLVLDESGDDIHYVVKD